VLLHVRDDIDGERHCRPVGSLDSLMRAVESCLFSIADHVLRSTSLEVHHLKCWWTDPFHHRYTEANLVCIGARNVETLLELPCEDVAPKYGPLISFPVRPDVRTTFDGVNR
jgi:hypothetical protein